MEENNTTKNNKLSYEQLEKIALQLQQKLMQANERLSQINLTTLRLDYLFRVVDRADKFPKEFVDKSVEEVINLLEVKEEASDEESPMESTEK